MDAPIIIITALKCEAYPLVEHFRLKRGSSCNMDRPLFSGNNIHLVISGVGQLNAKKAVKSASRYLTPTRQMTAWLNVGIGGHASCHIGQGFIANRIEDSSTGQFWYPSMTRRFRGNQVSVVTTDQVETEYEKDAVYEMEAAGFFDAACSQTKLELVQCYKIISDNKTYSPLELTREHISALIADHVLTVEEICSKISEMARELNSRTNPSFENAAYLSRWHFTETQRHLLKRLLNQCQVLKIDASIDSVTNQRCNDSRAVINELKARLNLHWQ